jgi:hypothetical protein
MSAQIWLGNPLDMYSQAVKLVVGVGVLLASDSQSTSKSGYRASLWDP